MVLWSSGFVLMTLLINAPLMPWFMRVTGLGEVCRLPRPATLSAPRLHHFQLAYRPRQPAHALFMMCQLQVPIYLWLITFSTGSHPTWHHQHLNPITL